jgi:hypothetical protein
MAWLFCLTGSRRLRLLKSTKYVDTHHLALVSRRAANICQWIHLFRGCIGGLRENLRTGGSAYQRSFRSG